MRSNKPGRALIAHMQLMRQGNDEKSAAERVRRREAGERANAEMMDLFAPLNSENVRAALEWQENRIRELMEGAA